MINEIGTLRALPNGESYYVGSSSGVFFINTVRRAFSHAAEAASRRSLNNTDNPSLSSLPSPEDCIFGPESHVEAAWTDQTGNRSNDGSIGELPSHATAKELLITYFRTWHPLLPFVHGPTCLEELEAIYAGDTNAKPRKPRSLSIAILLQCIFNIAKLDRPDLPPLGRSLIRSEEQLLFTVSIFSLKRDLASIQALLAAQLYFVATMSLQAASSTGGLVLRSIFKSGLHRCPFRYSTFNANDRDMRKRVFWSAYTLDRYMSQSLGHPLGIQDSDIDVCPPGKTELHEPVFSNNRMEEGTSPQESILHLPTNHPQRQHESAQNCDDSPHVQSEKEPMQGLGEEEPSELHSRRSNEGDSISHHRRQNQSVQAHIVCYSELVGRMLEMFHKSIHTRSASGPNILFLKADIDAWGNNMPYTSQEVPSSSDPGATPDARPAGLDQNVFFKVAQQQLLLLVNRPFLSLEPTTADFRHAIQLCIGAARSIIKTLDAHLLSHGSMFWPGFMSSVWMSGLVMVFACQVKLHSISNAISDITASLRILDTMKPRWSMAHNCYEVLSMLLESIRCPVPPQSIADGHTAYNRPSRSEALNGPRERPRKRKRDELPLGHPAGHDHRRVRLSRQGPQVPAVSSAMGFADTGQSFPTPLLNNVRPPCLSNGTEYGHIGMSEQSTGFATGTESYCYSEQLESGYFNSSWMPQSNRASMQLMQDVQIGDPEYTDTQGGVSGIPTNISLGSDPTAFYDVFDGAMLGSLLELCEPNEQ